MSTNASSPIGVFDSGIGGLTVVRALMERLPFENLIYFGDTARVPYGVKSVETISRFTTQIAEFLLARDVKLLIIACNTMAAVSAQVVRDLSPVPVLDVIEAGAMNALNASQSRRTGVIGTPTTVNSNAYVRAIHALQSDARVKRRIPRERVRGSYEEPDLLLDVIVRIELFLVVVLKVRCNEETVTLPSSRGVGRIDGRGRRRREREQRRSQQDAPRSRSHGTPLIAAPGRT